MADGALVLVDAAEGPMPQTRFVLSKALECGVRPIVVVNKIDRPDARPHEVVDEMLELFLNWGRTTCWTIFRISSPVPSGYATFDPAQPGDSIRPLMDLILEQIPGPGGGAGSTAANDGLHAGLVGIRRPDRHRAHRSGTIRKGQSRPCCRRTAIPRKMPRYTSFRTWAGWKSTRSTPATSAAVVGLEGVEIGDTIADPISPRRLPRIAVDEPTLKMTFGVNTSPLAGREGKFLTSRHLRERLMRELEKNVALRVEPIAGTEQFSVSGRGVLTSPC